MKFIGNYKDWIDPHWLTELLTNTGTARPKEGKRPDSPEEEAEYAKARAAGYKDDATFFYMFDKHNTSFNITHLPFSDQSFHWWITKMLPGNFMPMHVDPHTLYQSNSSRYWIPLQDYHPGHIFMYEDQVITNYRAGDVWTYSNAAAIHGASNIGHIPRLVLQISTYY